MNMLVRFSLTCEQFPAEEQETPQTIALLIPIFLVCIPKLKLLLIFFKCIDCTALFLVKQVSLNYIFDVPILSSPSYRAPALQLQEHFLYTFCDCRYCFVKFDPATNFLHFLLLQLIYYNGTFGLKGSWLRHL